MDFIINENVSKKIIFLKLMGELYIREMKYYPEILVLVSMSANILHRASSIYSRTLQEL
jgi:hypothetical protein